MLLPCDLNQARSVSIRPLFWPVLWPLLLPLPLFLLLFLSFSKGIRFSRLSGPHSPEGRSCLALDAGFTGHEP